MKKQRVALCGQCCQFHSLDSLYIIQLYLSYYCHTIVILSYLYVEIFNFPTFSRYEGSLSLGSLLLQGRLSGYSLAGWTWGNILEDFSRETWRNKDARYTRIWKHSKPLTKRSEIFVMCLMQVFCRKTCDVFFSHVLSNMKTSSTVQPGGATPQRYKVHCDDLQPSFQNPNQIIAWCNSHTLLEAAKLESKQIHTLPNSSQCLGTISSTVTQHLNRKGMWFWTLETSFPSKCCVVMISSKLVDFLNLFWSLFEELTKIVVFSSCQTYSFDKSTWFQWAD